MTPVEFLKEELQLLACKFPNVHIKYGFNTIIETHIVELLPLIEYNSNVELDRAWVPLSLKFMDIFTNEEIAFVSSDSTIAIKNVLFEFNVNSCKEENIINELFASLTKSIPNYSFPLNFSSGIIMHNSSINFLNQPIKELLDEKNYSEYTYLAAA